MGNGVADKRIFFLINPKAGGGAAGAWWKRQLPLLDEAKLDYFYEFTNAPGTAGEQIRRAVIEKGAEALLAVGGDGSLFEAINGMMTQEGLFEPELIFGVYPLGSGCDFARSIYGKKAPSLTELIAWGRVERIDVGCCLHMDSAGEQRRHYFINSFDIGAGADTCVRVNAKEGRIKRLTRSGKLSFLLSALKVLLSFDYTKTAVEADGRKYEGEYIIVGAGNGKYIGGGMLMFPYAALNDGMLDILLVERRSRLQILRTFPLIYSGRHLSKPGIYYGKAASVCIKTQRPIHIELDGEVPGCTEVFLSVLPQALPILVPDKD